MAGLRVGLLATVGPVYDRLVTFKSFSDLATSNLIQHALDEFVTVGLYQANLRCWCTGAHTPGWLVCLAATPRGAFQRSTAQISGRGRCELLAR